MKQRHKRFIIEAAKEVFNTMISLDIKEEEPYEEIKPQLPKSITGMIGLAGKVSGLFSIHFSKEAALQVASSLRGVEMKEIDDNVKDTVGEMANMIAGVYKNKVSDKEEAFAISIPLVITGQRYAIGPLTGNPSTVFPFTFDGGRFFVELTIEGNS